ncbi:hypothetical protein [Enterobacter cloacae complex sp. 2024EL-00227]|uniref:hypothetical protein n=1 Tax=Enterobacter cloacae complex sp. 2024EL-00227 TaxID=3374272 RepID=UPI00375304E2
MSNIDKQTLTLKERIEKALSDFTKGRASMHVPPLDTDVDMVLADCLTALEKLEATATHSNAGWKEAHEQEARAEAAEKRIAELEAREINLPPYSFFDFKQGSSFKSGAYCHIDSVNKELSKHGIKIIAAAGKGEAS